MKCRARIRSFTRHELTEGITTGQYNAMRPDEQKAFDRQLLDLWSGRTDDEPRGFNDEQNWNGRRIGTMHAYEWGE